jgi:hypothetical protein
MSIVSREPPGAQGRTTHRRSAAAWDLRLVVTVVDDFVFVETPIDENAQAQRALDTRHEFRRRGDFAEDAICSGAAARGRPRRIDAARIRANRGVRRETAQLAKCGDRFDVDEIDVDEDHAWVVPIDLVRRERIERCNDIETAIGEQLRQERREKTLRFDDRNRDRLQLHNGGVTRRWHPVKLRTKRELHKGLTGTFRVTRDRVAVLDEAGAQSVDGGLRARRAIELGENAADVILDRLLREMQIRADLFIGHAGDDQPDDFDFT